MIRNVHERPLPVPATAAGALIDSLAGPADRLWPRHRWPAMCLDRRLTVGAAGGHGPIRYTVQLYRPARHVRFRFDAPRGFDGHHEYEVLPDGENACRLRHSLVLTPHGVARLTWSLIFRPLHDALIEDSLDTAERSLGLPSPSPSRWPATVHVLRSPFRALAGIRRAV